MTRYAERTTVAPEKSRLEIEQTLKRFGAGQYVFAQMQDKAIVGFSARDRQVRFFLPMPERSKFRSDAAYQQEERRRWRSLLIVLKAKLESIATGIETFEEAFLAHIVTAEGRTVYEMVKEPLAISYRDGHTPELLALPAPRNQPKDQP